jgi:6-phosphogluconolactonase
MSILLRFSMALALCLLAAPTRGDLVYVTNAADNTVSGYGIGSGGALTALSNSPYPAGNTPLGIAADHLGQFLYVANSGGANISAYTIDSSTGVLTAASGSPFAAGNGPFTMVVNPRNTVLYVTNQGDNTVSGYTIDAGGVLTPVSDSPFATGNFPTCVEVIPPSHSAYVTNRDDNTIWRYRIGSGGQLIPVADSPFATGNGPNAVVASLEYVYVTNGADGTISGYVASNDGHSNGQMTPITGSPFSVGVEPNQLLIDTQDERLMYVVSQGANTISVFSIGTGGVLTAVAGPFATGDDPTGVAINNSGTYLYVVNAGDNNISGYSIERHGFGRHGEVTLTPLAGSPFATGNDPQYITIAIEP